MSGNSPGADAVKRMLRHRTIISVLLTILVISSSLHGRDRQAARAAYKKARSYHDQLLETAQSDRGLRKYQSAIFLYRTVIDHDPTYGACDDALYAVATLYEEMAQRFQREVYQRRAIYYYEFVAREYPLTKYKKAALERSASLKRDAASGQRVATTSSERQTAIDQSNLATVSEVRYWSNEDYTRVVIQLDREVEFQKHILSDPDRIYFDLEEAHLRPDLRGKSYPVNDLFLKRLRVGQNRATVVRVVLDFEKINKHTVFALYDPFRIVIDTLGGELQGATLPDTGGMARPQGDLSPEETATDQGRALIDIPVVPASNLGGDRSLTRVLGLKVGRVVIDPGHGGRDTGTIGPSGLKEKDLVLALSQRLKELLEEHLKTDVVLTRTSDTFVPLEERTAIANQVRADLFVSLHANSSTDHKVSGVETFFLNFSSNADEREVASRENAGSQKNIRDLEDLLKQIALGDYNEESKDLAHVVQESLYLRMNDRNRGVKKAPFIVLINLNMPAILTEVGFISNPADERYFKNKNGQEETAKALYEGVEKYLRSLGAVPAYPGATAVNTSSQN